MLTSVAELVLPVVDASLAYATAASVAAGIVVGFNGFGSGLVMMPLLALIYGPAPAVVIVTLASLFGGLQLIPQVWRHIDWRDSLPMAIAGSISVPVGTYLLLTLDPVLVRRAIGVGVLVFALSMLTGLRWSGPHRPSVSAAAGLVAGFLAGSAGVGGVILSMYFLSARASAVVMRANIAFVQTAFPFVIVASLLVGGAMVPETLVRFVLLMIPHAVAIWIGARFFRGASDAFYRRVVLLFIVAIGAAAVVA
jgi:uncharacterized membrane protein YfcA